MPSSALPLHIQDTPAGTILPSSHTKVPLSASALPQSARTGISAFSTTESVAAQNLDAVIAELQQANHDVTHLYDNDDEDTDDESDHGQPGLRHKINHIRARMRHFLHLPSFHYTIILLVIIDLVVVFIDLVVSLLNLPCYNEDQKLWFEEHGLTEFPPNPSCKLEDSHALESGEWFLWAVSVFLLTIFIIELFLSGIAFGLKHFKKPIYFIDAVIVTASLILEIYFKVGDGGRLETAPSAIIALRLWKIVRAVHAIAHSIELKNQAIIKAVKEAKEQLEESYSHVMEVLEQQQLQITYLRKKAPEVSDEELEGYVEREMKEREKVDESEAKEKEDA